ncbi:MAG: glutathione S-transferase family protein [Pseudomonadota bacterium]
MTKVILHQYEISPYADKVRRVLHLKQVDYETSEVLITKQGAARKISPTGKFPAMEWDGETIVDSTDIIRFLNEKVPNPPLIPADPKQKALAHIIEDWADESLYFYDLAIRCKPNNSKLLADDIAKYESPMIRWLIKRVIPGAAKKIGTVQGLARKDAAVLDREITAHFDALEVMLSDQDWLVGEALSIADIAVASMIFVLNRAEEPAASLKRMPKLEAWRARVDGLTLPPEGHPAG